MISSIDLHFLQMATVVSQSDVEPIRDASRVQVHRKPRGAVLAKGNKTLATGKSTHLGSDLDDLNVSERYTATLNAEIVVLSDYFKKNQGNLDGCTLYLTSCPNWITWKTITALGLRRILFYGEMSDPKIAHYSQKIGIETLSIA